MTERPILFSAPMVSALLAGTKTQTRRVVKPTRGRPIDFLGGGPIGGPEWNNPECWGYEHHDSATWVLLRSRGEPDDAQYPCPYGQPGDQLWVRETFAEGIHQMADVNHWAYAADHFGAQQRLGDRWTPSIHMPRWASRITLEITSMRVERLQDISVADAIAEGCPGGEHGDRYAALEQYRALWESINGPGSWDANPWVWVVEFRRLT